ncbi:polyisoprenoid diphosphate/phosphate phosphohydrolase PLPP6 [Cylas formicarius]|uniref:polyisoprenoid diphosphate/phosphate phosphohydrolase PLPP6 n=1 Tax=Cylas formicarius TaxID=197179 RepID=UPI00295860C4|nr:polyisoprenoid diphosphate/phosphate phosphohydrolase PLPP6 [Cylas formicarius]
MGEAEKRRPPGWVRRVLDLDAAVTKRFVQWGNGVSPLHSLRVHCKALEITCHGIPWLAFWTAFTWLFNNPHLIELQVNMLFGLVLDIIVVALTKAYFRRRRPAGNRDDAFVQLGSDQFSFPSGHASRAVLVAYVFTRLWPLSFLFYPSIMAWVVALGMSRVLMERHYILDVIGGYGLGLIEGGLLGLLWISDENARWLMSVVSDEKFEGGDYHV